MGNATAGNKGTKKGAQRGAPSQKYRFNLKWRRQSSSLELLLGLRRSYLK